MPIEIKEGPEPLSEGSLSASAEILLLESEGSRLLQRELQRYAEGQITGRSFLISGHRGAGKTTLVAKAFLDVWQESVSRERFLRPLFVALHGPSLFPTDEPPEPALVPASVTPTAPQPPVVARRSLAQIALEQITLGLHRAVTREFSERYYERIGDLAYLRRHADTSRAQIATTRQTWLAAKPSPSTGPGVSNELLHIYPEEWEVAAGLQSLSPDQELFEMAAQFDLELQDGPSARRLHDFWRRANAASGGVLYRRGYAPLVHGAAASYATPPPPLGLRIHRPEVDEQGPRELVALASVVEAHRRISGEYKRTEEQRDTSQRAGQQSVELSFPGQQLGGPVAALITGGLAGTGLALAGATPLVTAASGVLAAVASSFVLSSASTRKREQVASRHDSFIYDLSVATLDRVLPMLVQRLRQAGLAPVFVVDELDKVDNLSDRIMTMVHHLKKLVAENSFFCFLTDRSYFEGVIGNGAREAYPVEHTYYTHRLFVVHSAEDFERYLRARIPDPPRTPSNESGEERAARAILRFTVRHRAQLHLGDLQREIAAMRDNAGHLRIDPKRLVSSQRTLIDLTFQVAIERLLAGPELQQVVLDRPEFGQLLHDAFYFVTRRWLEGATGIDGSDAGKALFADYLAGRAGIAGKRSSAGTAQRAPAGAVPASDVDFLFGQVKRLANALAEPDTSDAASSWSDWHQQRSIRGLPEVESDVLDAVLRGAASSLLIVPPPGAAFYAFRYRVRGGKWPTAAGEADAPAALDGASPIARWREDVRFIQELLLPLPVKVSDLQGTYGVVPQTPAWDIVAYAISNLEAMPPGGAAPPGNGSPHAHEDAFAVTHFRGLLERNLLRIAQALWCGLVIGLAAGVGGPAAFGRGLAEISRARDFGRASEAAIGHALEDILAQIEARFGLKLDLEIHASPTLSDVRRLHDKLRQTLQASPGGAPVNLESEAWVHTLARLYRWIKEGTAAPAELAELMAGAASMGPRVLLGQYDPARLSAADWVDVLLSLRKHDAMSGSVLQQLGLLALHALGVRGAFGVFARRLATGGEEPSALMARFPTDARPLFGASPGQRVIVIRRNNSPRLAALAPAPGIECWVATITQMSALLEPSHGLDPLFESLPVEPLTIIALEMDPESHRALEAQIYPALSRLSPFIVHLYSEDRGRDMRSPFLLEPHTFERITDAVLGKAAP